MICRKTTFTISVSAVMVPMPISSLLEHKVGVFVRFLASEPLFSGISSTKSAFLCFFGLRDPHFRAFRAQNRGFCAFLPFGTPVFRLFEHKNGIFVRCAEGGEGGGVKLSFFCVMSGVNCRIFLLNLQLHWLS